MFKFKVEAIRPVQIDINTDNTSLNIQQSLLLQQKYQALEIINQANDSLDKKAATLLQASALIVALTGVLSIPGFIRTDNPVAWAKVGIAVAFLLFAGMIILSAIAWFPKGYYLPGSLDWDWDELYKQYLLVDSDSSFNQVLRDCTVTIERLKVLNYHKGLLLKISAGLFVVQIIGLMIIPFFT